MAPRGGGPGGPRLLSILSSLAFDGPFSIRTGTYQEKEPQETDKAAYKEACTCHQNGFLQNTQWYFFFFFRKYSDMTTIQDANMNLCAHMLKYKLIGYLLTDSC